MRTHRTFPHHLWSVITSHSLLKLHQFWLCPHNFIETACIKVFSFLLPNPNLAGQICKCLLQQYWAQVITLAFFEESPLRAFLTPHYFGFHPTFLSVLSLCSLLACLLYFNSKCRNLLGSVSPSVMSYTLTALYITYRLTTSIFSANFSLSFKLTYCAAYITNFLLGWLTGISNLTHLNMPDFPICSRQNDAPCPFMISTSQSLGHVHIFKLHGKEELRFPVELRLLIS